jgi:pilus assembly protein CpaE
MPLSIKTFEDLHDGQLSVAVIGPDGQGRTAATTALAQCENVQTHEFTNYPSSLDDVPHLLKQGFDAFLIDLDGSPEYALELVEKFCTAGSSIVMVFSARADTQLMLRSMHAGAREFFTLPFSQGALTKALLWIAARRQAVPATRTADGRMLVFFGSKGGVGVTTLATNFAVALAAECRQSTVLIDFNLNLGDAARTLGIDAPHSIIDALENPDHVDTKFLSKLLVRHSSGLFVLAAPQRLTSTKASVVEFGRLLAAARQLFSYVVVDAGKKIDLNQLHLFDESATAYLVTQAGIPELRNANRLISQFSVDRSPKLEIVINRHQSRSSGITEEHLAKALARPIRWRVPNDFKAVSEMHSSGTPIVDQDLPIGHVIRQMARSACGLPDPVRSAIKSGFSKGIFSSSWKDAARRLNPDRSKAEPERSNLSPDRPLSDLLPH